MPEHKRSVDGELALEEGEPGENEGFLLVVDGPFGVNKEVDFLSVVKFSDGIQVVGDEEELSIGGPDSSEHGHDLSDHDEVNLVVFLHDVKNSFLDS